MKRIFPLFLVFMLIMATLPLSYSVFAADDVLDGERFLDEIIVEFYDISMFPGKEKQYQDEVAKILKDGLDIITENVYVIEVDDLSRNPNAFINRFKNSKYIKYAEPNFIATVESTPNDPNYKTISAVLNALNAPQGWNIVSSGGPLIAVVDTGFASHSDLPAAQNGYSAVSSLAYKNDSRGHGTQVAGVAAALGNNGVGTTGINWKANIMPVKVDDASGVLSVANVAKGIMWAADNGAKIINLSLGSQSDSTTMKNAINYAYNKGCVLVAASGNEGVSGISYPARYANVLGVGSTLNGTSRANSSNYGDGLDVIAVGTYSTTTASGGYTIVTGTSFASPQAAALASLMWEIDPSLTNDEIYSLIRDGAKPLGGGYNDQTAYGLMDIGKTLSLVNGGVVPIVKDATAPVLTLNGSPVMEIMRGGMFVEPGYTAVDDIDSNITSKVIVTGSVDVNTPGVYRLEYKVSDAAGNTSTATRVVEVMGLDITQPILTLKGGAKVLVPVGGSFIEPGYTAVDDIDGDITGKVVVTGIVDVNVPGEYRLEYKISDTAGNVRTETRVVEITAAVIPEPEIPQYNPPADLDSGVKSFLTEAASGNRNNYGGSVGYEFECLEDMTVSVIGRPLNGVMNSSHKIYIWQVSDKTLLAAAEVKPDSPLDELGFKIAELDGAITLKAGQRYRIASEETVGGDRWFDVDQTYNLVPNADCRIITPVYTNEGAYTSYPGNEYNPGGVKGYVGVTFYYQTASGIPQVPEPQPAVPEYNAPPSITLAGFTDMSLFVDDEYVEAGYKAVDCYGVDLTGAVKVTHNVNTLAPGFYTVNYVVEDAGGNIARASRTVTVLEREVPPPPATAPTLTIIGSDPIILHLDSDTPYTEQGACAFDEIDGDISDEVEVSGKFDRNREGTYTLTYAVTNSAGLSATATREVRILAPNEVSQPQQSYSFSGQGKADSTTTHDGVTVDNEGYMDFSVTNIDKNMAIYVEVINRDTNSTDYSDAYTSSGETQFWVDAGSYDIDVTIESAKGNSKYGIRLVTPEVSYFEFEEEEVPLSSPELINKLISEGNSPLEICLMFSLFPEMLGEYYDDFIAAGWTDNDLAWFGIKDIVYEEAPLGNLTDANLTTYVVVDGDNLSSIAYKLYGDTIRWREIYDMNKEAIGSNPNFIYPGQVLTIKAISE